MVRFLPRLRRQKAVTPTPPPIQAAIAIGSELYFDGDQLPIRSGLEQDFRNLQAGAAGVSDGGLTKAVMSVVAMFVCVNWLGNQARSVPLVVLDRQGEPVDHSPLDWFLRNQSESILGDCTKSLNVWGKAFLRKQRNKMGYPLGLEFINPNNIRQETDNTGRITGYLLYRTREQIPVADIIYIDLFSFTGDGNPHSPTEAAFIEAGIQSGQATYAVSFFFNQAVPAGMVTFDPPLEPQEYEVAKMEWRKNFKGAAKAHKIALMNNKATFTPFQVGMKDLAMDTLDDASKQKICAAYGVNPATVGLGDVAAGLNARSTFEDTKRASIESAVVPMAQIIAAELTQQWAAPDLFPKDFYSIHTNERVMPALSDVNADRVGVTSQLVASNAWGIDEQREFLGQSPRENTEERLYWREDIGQAERAYNAGLITNVQFNQLTGLPLPSFAMRKIDGKTIAEASVTTFIEENALLPNEQPSFFSVKPIDALPVIESPKLPPPPKPADTKSDRRSVELDGTLSVGFGNHTLLKMARRQLAKMIPADLEAQWVADADWRLDMLLLSPCSTELVGAMVAGFDVQNRSHVELWGSEFVRVEDTIFLCTDIPEGFVSFRDSVISHMQVDLQASPEPTKTMRIKMVTVPGMGKVEFEPIAAIPLTIDNIILVIDNEVRCEWVIERVTEEQRRELRKWQRKLKDAKRHGKPEPEFHVEELPEHVAAFVREQLTIAGRSLNDIWAEARKRLEARAIQSTRLDYEDKIDGFIREAVAGNINRARMGVLMRGENSRFVQLAYRDGLIDGGVLDGVPTDDDKEVIDSLIRKANSFVSNFTAEVFSGKLSQTQLLTKPAQWYRGAINPAYTNGLLSADKNGMYECVRLRPSKNPCVDCIRLQGQRHRLSAWARRDLMMGSAGQNTECEGFNCNHTLKKTRGRARGSW
jgi:HK97 family phage portal protein